VGNRGSWAQGLTGQARAGQAEAEYWRRSEGFRTGWSDQLLGFDCGGQQWVLEVAFPTGTLRCALAAAAAGTRDARKNDQSIPTGFAWQAEDVFKLGGIDRPVD
jgi:hypothetical protein